MRKTFANELLTRAKKDKNIVLITMDLGYFLWDEFREQLPEQFFNVGSSEQAGMGIAVGMALEGRTVFVYSITPFLLFRAAETIRNYVNKESIPCKLIGSGRSDDYKHDGWSHHAGDDYKLLECFENINCRWPDSEDEIEGIVDEMINNPKPYYLNLKR